MITYSKHISTPDKTFKKKKFIQNMDLNQFTDINPNDSNAMNHIIIVKSEHMIHYQDLKT